MENQDILIVRVQDTPETFRQDGAPFRLVGRESLMPLPIARRQAAKFGARILKIVTSDRKLVGHLTAVPRFNDSAT